MIEMRPGWVPAPPGFREMLDRRQHEAEMRISDTPNRQFINTLEDRIQNISMLKSIDMMMVGQNKEMRCEMYRGTLVFYIGEVSDTPISVQLLTDMEVERVIYLRILDSLAKLVMEMSSIAPRIMDTSNGGHVLMMFVRLEKCPECGRFMVQRSLSDVLRDLQMSNLHNQDIKEIAVNSVSYDTDFKHICDRCEKAGRVTFRCYLCEQEYPTSEVEWSVGDPRECLCKSCYGTVSAERWDNAVGELEKAHRYDYH